MHTGCQIGLAAWGSPNKFRSLETLASFADQVAAAELQKLIDTGVSRAALARRNDRIARFDMLPSERWAPALNQSN